MSNYRSAFPGKSHNDALEHNVDKIVQMTQLKVKEMLNKKQETIRQSNLLKGQKAVIEADIIYNERETRDREELIAKMTEEYDQVNKEISDLEVEYKVCLNEYNERNQNLKSTINSVNDDYTSVSVANGVEETNKKQEMRKEYEAYLAIKNENQLYMDKMHNLRHELYYLELGYKESADQEIERIYKTKKGIEAINKLYE